MKLPGLTQLLPKKQDHGRDLYISLLLYPRSIEVGFWELSPSRGAVVLAARHTDIATDSWEEREKAIDAGIGQLEEVTGLYDVERVILGLPAVYLTEKGEIQQAVRSHIKKLTHQLSLSPIGYVSTYQAILHRVKHEEGVPPSIILYDVSSPYSIAIYKVGVLAGVQTISTEPDVTHALEIGLQRFSDLEVLPSRIVLYGDTRQVLDEARRQVLRHPWQSKANFMHFPKVDVLDADAMVQAVSLAGASELGATLGDEPEDEVSVVTHTPPVAVETPEPTHPVEEVVVEEQPNPIVVENVQVEDNGESVENVTFVDPEALGFTNREPVNTDTPDEATAEPIIHGQEDGIAPTPKPQNIRIMSHASITDQRSEREEKHVYTEEENEEELESPKKRFSMPAIPHVRFPTFGSLPGRVLFIVALLVLVFSGVAGAYMWFVPQATVTIQLTPHTISKSDTVQVLGASTETPSTGSLSVTGNTVEKTVRGEKTMSTTGKKNVGDPAKGKVTIYNKSTSSRSFKKGSILSTGSIQFNLDDDVQVASASESIGSITFGKATVAVTATAIGTQGNIASGKEFTFKDVSSNVAIARNDDAFGGGTSKEVKVVSRADQDGLVKTLTQELIEQAKNEIAQETGNGEVLIPETIKTSVTEKQFDKELNEEAASFTGSISVQVTGLSYKSESISQALATSVSSDIPPGYSFDPTRTTISVQDTTVQKDSSVRITAQFDATALPEVNLGELQQTVAGKSVAALQESLKQIQGVGSVDVQTKYNIFSGRLPINKNNITVLVATP